MLPRMRYWGAPHRYGNDWGHGCLLRTLRASMWAERGGMPRAATWTYVDRCDRSWAVLSGPKGLLLTTRINEQASLGRLRTTRISGRVQGP